jgi:hypothetical protein
MRKQHTSWRNQRKLSWRQVEKRVEESPAARKRAQVIAAPLPPGKVRGTRSHTPPMNRMTIRRMVTDVTECPPESSCSEPGKTNEKEESSISIAARAGKIMTK